MGIIEYLKMVRATPAWDRVPAISDAELDAMIDILQKNKSINGVSILKCDECNGRDMLLSLLGFVALENAVCVMEQAKLRLYRRVRQKVNTEQQRFLKSLETCRRSRKSTAMLVSM